MLKRFVLPAFTVFMLALLLARCDQKTINYQSSQGGSIAGSITGTVRDRQTGSGLSGVQVRYFVQDRSRTVSTDNQGYYFIEGLCSGDHELTFTGSGSYAVTKAVVKIPALCDAGTEAEGVPFSVVKNVDLFPLNAGLRGRIFARDKQGGLLPGSGVRVIAQVHQVDAADSAAIPDQVEPSLYETTTNFRGEYVFDRTLPCVSSFRVQPLPFSVEGAAYESVYALSPVSTQPDLICPVPDIIALPTAFDVVLLKSPFANTRFPVSEDIEIVFSKPMDPTGFEARLTIGWNAIELFCSASWSADSLTLTLDPADLLASLTTYSVTLEGRTGDGYAFFMTGQFVTENTNIFLIDGPIGKSGFPVDQNLVFLFSKPIDTETFKILLRREYQWGQELYFSLAWSGGNTVLTLDPYVTLKSNTNYYVEYSGKGEQGGTITGSGTFYTGGQVSNFLMVRTNLMVVDGEYMNQFPAGSSIELEFNKPVQPDSGLVQLMKMYEYTYVEILPGLSDDQKVLTLDPVQNLQHGTEYMLNYTVYSQSGDLANGSIQFRTAP